MRNNISNIIQLKLPYLLFAYILLPFQIWGIFSFPNEAEKIIISFILSIILLLFNILKAKNTYSKITVVDIIVFFYFIYYILIFQYPIEYETLFHIASLFILYLFFRTYITQYFLNILLIIPVSGLIQIIIEIINSDESWYNLSHISGGFYNTGIFGGFISIACTIFLGIILFIQNNKIYFNKILWSSILALLLIQLICSNSRASWIAFIVSASYLICPLFIRFIKKKQFIIPKVRIVFFAIIILFLSLFAIIYLYQLKKDSADGRLLIARISMEMVKDKPIFGHKILGFRSNYMNYQADFFEKHPDSDYSLLADDIYVPLNEYLRIFVEQGIVGLILFFILIFNIFRVKDRTEKKPDAVLRITKAMLASILIFALFSYPFDKIQFNIIFVSCLAIIAQKSDKKIPIKRSIGKLPFLGPVIYIATCITVLAAAIVAVNYMSACIKWGNALKNFPFERNEVLHDFEEVYPVLKNNPQYLITYERVLTASKFNVKAIEIIQQTIKLRPSSDLYIELGKLYADEGKNKQALTCWETAHNMVPARFTPDYLSMKLYLQQGETAKAKQIADYLLSKKIKIESPSIDRIRYDAKKVLTETDK